MKPLVILTNKAQTQWKVGRESDIENAIALDEGVVSPCMGLPKKYWYQDAIILTFESL